MLSFFAEAGLFHFYSSAETDKTSEVGKTSAKNGQVFNVDLMDYFKTRTDYSQTCVLWPLLGPKNIGLCWQVVIVECYLYAIKVQNDGRYRQVVVNRRWLVVSSGLTVQSHLCINDHLAIAITKVTASQQWPLFGGSNGIRTIFSCFVSLTSSVG